MQKSGFVFPGQGSQKSGMLAELHAAYPEVQQTFAEASEALSMDLWQIISADSTGLLDQTHITQPALLAASVAIWRLWNTRHGQQPALLAGHSLGEYSALVCANVIDLQDAIRIVHKRGQYMQQAVPAGTGAMAAILGLDDDKIIAVCAEVSQESVVSPANFNSIGQTVIAGHKDAVDRAIQACKEAGAKRALPLNVSVPSHCALMVPAARQLAEELQQLTFRSPSIPVVQNIDGKVTSDPGSMKENLLKQLYMPVQWVKSINYMTEQGVSHVIECGPGKVLCGLVKRIDANIECFATEDCQSFEQAKAALS